MVGLTVRQVSRRPALSMSASTPIDQCWAFEPGGVGDGRRRALQVDAVRVPGALVRPDAEFPQEAGYWSVTTADGVYEVSRDWETYSSERGGITAVTHWASPSHGAHVHRDGIPPKHDRIKALFSAGSRRSGSPSTRTPSARSPATSSTTSRGARRGSCRRCRLLVVARVIGKLQLGLPQGDVVRRA